MRSLDSNALVVQANSKPGVVTFDNYNEIKDWLQNGLEYYNGFTYSLDNYDMAVANRDELKKLKKALEEKRKEIEKWS